MKKSTIAAMLFQHFWNNGFSKLQPSITPKNHPHLRSKEQKLEAKKLIEDWRRKEFLTDSESYVLDTIMDDNNINKLTENLGRISSYESIHTITDWSEWVVDSKRRLVDMLIALDNKFDNPQQKNIGNSISMNISQNPLPNILDLPLPNDIGDGFENSSIDDAFQILEYPTSADFGSDDDDDDNSDSNDNLDSSFFEEFKGKVDYPLPIYFENELED
ncbi:hypothetical protein FBU30_000489 [Linnemannia zychae]|nr:hypothetical protein FBU30_000489 [Linnemannia zychae]